MKIRQIVNAQKNIVIFAQRMGFLGKKKYLYLETIFRKKKSNLFKEHQVFQNIASAIILCHLGSFPIVIVILNSKLPFKKTNLDIYTFKVTL